MQNALAFIEQNLTGELSIKEAAAKAALTLPGRKRRFDLEDSRSFLPWEDGFSKGLYLAGTECGDHAEPPAGWTKWVIPGYEYIYVENENDGVFSEVLGYLQENGIPLAGAVHDFNCPETGKQYLFFPIRRL